MKKLKSVWNNLEVYLMISFLVIFLLNITLQIFLRVFFKSPLSFTEEVSRYAFVWMVFLGLSYATKHDRHIRVDVFITKMPKSVQFWVEMFINTLTLAVFIWIFINGVKYIDYSSISRTYALNIQKSYVVSIIPLSGALMIIRIIEKFVRDIKAYYGI